jgi:hypothetical protein
MTTPTFLCLIHPVRFRFERPADVPCATVLAGHSWVGKQVQSRRRACVSAVFHTEQTCLFSWSGAGSRRRRSASASRRAGRKRKRRSLASTSRRAGRRRKRRSLASTRASDAGTAAAAAAATAPHPQTVTDVAVTMARAARQMWVLLCLRHESYEWAATGQQLSQLPHEAAQSVGAVRGRGRKCTSVGESVNWVFPSIRPFLFLFCLCFFQIPGGCHKELG